jgi:alpha,alpha-trehalose phosphorylase
MIRHEIVRPPEFVYPIDEWKMIEARFYRRTPAEVARLRFPLTIRGQTLDVEITDDTATYTLRDGSELTIAHCDEEIRLRAGVPESRKL